MKKIISIVCLILLATHSFSQEKYNLNFLGYQYRIIDLMPSEISYIRISETSHSFSVRAGYGKGRKNELNIGNIFNNYNTINYSNNSTYYQNFEVFFIKPGYVIHKKIKNKSYSLLLVNLNASFCKDRMSITSNDKLYGTIIANYEEFNYYSSIECERIHLIKLFPKLILGINYLVGYKINYKAPFSKIIPGLENASSYTPSQGFGKVFYFNTAFSVMYKF